MSAAARAGTSPPDCMPPTARAPASTTTSSGADVAVDKKRLVVGAQGDSAWDRSGAKATLMENVGSVSVFRLTPAGKWGLEARLTQPTAAADHRFGKYVDVHGDVIAAVAGQSATPKKFAQTVLFRRLAGKWVAVAQLTDTADTYRWHAGRPVLHGDRLLVGSRSQDSTGAVMLYDIAGTPKLIAKLRPSVAASGDSVGVSFAYDGGHVLVGAPNRKMKNNTGSTMTGAGAAFLLAPRGSCDTKGQCACKPGWGGPRCDVKVDVCKADALKCEDGNDCTKDTCDPKKGCVHAPDDQASCSDGQLCTVGDACKGGACVMPAPLTCKDDGDKCTTEACAPKTGKCATAQVPCDDKNPCTKDVCAKDKGCTHTALDSGSCDDGDKCTVASTCSKGVCVATKHVDCSATDYNTCNRSRCDPANGKCTKVWNRACEDNNPCTKDACSATKPKATCTYTKEPDYTRCGGDGMCLAGVCRCPEGTLWDGVNCVACRCNSWPKGPGKPLTLVDIVEGFRTWNFSDPANYDGLTFMDQHARSGDSAFVASYRYVGGKYQGYKWTTVNRGPDGRWKLGAELSFKGHAGVAGRDDGGLVGPLR